MDDPWRSCVSLAIATALLVLIPGCPFPPWGERWWADDDPVDDDDAQDDDDDAVDDDDSADDDDVADDDDSADDDDDDSGCVDGAIAAGQGGTSWVTICGGTYQMGSTTGGDSEEPVHTVSIPTFEILETQVTVAQYGQCPSPASCSQPDTNGDCNWDENGHDQHPVNCVTWEQAEDYCDWVGGRLPSESEWEYAARSGGQDDTYPWGEDYATCDYAVMYGLNDYGCGTGRTWPVCGMRPDGDTDQGLCDMAGNVWEWVRDVYHGCYDCSECPNVDDCDESSVAPSDGTAWEYPAGIFRAYRGGSYVNGSSSELRATYRYYYYYNGGQTNVGFRCAR